MEGSQVEIYSSNDWIWVKGIVKTRMDDDREENVTTLYVLTEELIELCHETLVPSNSDLVRIQGSSNSQGPPPSVIDRLKDRDERYAKSMDVNRLYESQLQNVLSLPIFVKYIRKEPRKNAF